MATLDFLPATTYTPPPPGQARRKRRSLNTIIEDEEESNRGSMSELRKSRNPSPRQAQWLSPLSDHFPTPRGVHFMSAPIAPSTVDSDNEDSYSQAPSSAPWTRDSYTTDATEFDDLYDASSDEERRRKTRSKRISTQQSTNVKRSSMSSTSSRTSLSSLPALVIPGGRGGGDPWPGVAAFKMLTSPVPPTPPPKVPMSPAIFKYLQSHEVPSCSAPPSLDGSFSSEQFAAMSAPPTPDVGNDSDAAEEWGVQLDPQAMATLQALSGGDDLFEQQTEQLIELTHVTESPREMEQILPPLITNIRRNDSIVLSPAQQRSLNSLSRLEIPSPGGFFSSLSPGTRHTWHLVACTPESAHPPSSTTAEHFYKTPWSSAPIERIVEVSETASDGLPTARPTFNHPKLHHESSEDTITGIPPHSSPVEEIIPDEMLSKIDYASKLNVNANIDRTGLWLAAQSDYLSDLINPTEERDDEVALLKRAASTKSQISISSRVTEVDLKENPLPDLSVVAPRKTVRFSNFVTTSDAVAAPLPTTIGRQESAYYRAFQSFISESRYRDIFVHRIPRFEALQAQRVSFAATHRAHLLGKYQLSVVPMSAKRRLSSNVARGDEIPPEDPEKLKRDREFEARQQMSFATWNLQAIKLLNGGRLIAAPVAKRLARLSSMGPKMDGTPRDRARILDLGGQATCDWAWHCATEYPNTKVYTVTTKSLRQLSNSNIRGPSNHRNVAVERLTKLPFKNNQFDLISAREIYTILRSQAPNGEDEWASCLAECYRVLKPGGYLEFSILDSDVVNAGPLGLAKSVEFGYTLKTLGYDPYPTKTILSRLSASGFTNIKRAWLFLPMGENASLKREKEIKRDSKGEVVKLELEAMVSGSTEDVACVTGIVGGWAWEKWLLRAKVRMDGEEGVEGGVEGVAEVVEEGRGCGAGWRVVNGWARKPL